MPSNLHPDMSGNILDEPFHCEQCGREVKEEDAFGIPAHPKSQADELLFCSNDCVNDFLDKRRD